MNHEATVGGNRLTKPNQTGGISRKTHEGSNERGQLSSLMRVRWEARHMECHNEMGKQLR